VVCKPRTQRKRTLPEELSTKSIKNESILGFVLQAGSSSSGFLVWKPPNKETPPGEVFSISSFVNLDIKDNLNIKVNKILYHWLLLLNPFWFRKT